MLLERMREVPVNGKGGKSMEQRKRGEKEVDRRRKQEGTRVLSRKKTPWAHEAYKQGVRGVQPPEKKNKRGFGGAAPERKKKQDQKTRGNT